MRLRRLGSCIALLSACLAAAACDGSDEVSRTLDELQIPRGINCIPAGDKAYLIDRGQSSLVSINRQDGGLFAISSGTWVGKGPALSAPSALALDPDAESAVVFADSALLQINLQTGARSLLRKNNATRPIRSVASSGQSLYALDLGRGIVELARDGTTERVLTPWAPTRGEPQSLSAGGASLWVAAVAVDGLTEVDTRDGRVLRTLQPPLDLTPIDVLARDGALWVLAGGSGDGRGLWRVDPAAASYTQVSGGVHGVGEPFGVPTSFCIADATQEAWVLDATAKRIWIVDLATGNRTVLLGY